MPKKLWVRGFWFLALALLPLSAAAREAKDAEPVNYGVGLLCPRPDTQIAFYMEGDEQDAAGTIAYDNGAGFIVTSGKIKDLKNANGFTLDKVCDNGVQGIRVDSKRDGWLQVGTIWLAPNQEWDYADWQDLLHKIAVWRPLGPVTLYQGTADAPAPEHPYAVAETKAVEIYPLKFADNFALVVLDERNAFAKNCAGTPVPPSGSVGWMRLSGDDGKPVAAPAHPEGCK